MEQKKAARALSQRLHEQRKGTVRSTPPSAGLAVRAPIAAFQIRWRLVGTRLYSMIACFQYPFPLRYMRHNI